jgi:protein TonB
MRTLLGSDRPEDRLATTVFIAALLHGLVILGIRFTAPDVTDHALPTLEVLLVPEGPKEDDNPEASYIAERSQRGAGTTRERQRTSLPEATASLLESPGELRGDAPDRAEAGETADRTRLLASRSPRSPRTSSESAAQLDAVAATPQEMRPIAQVGLNAVAADETLRLRGEPATDDRLLADTRESQIAGYLDGWKRRIERAGTLNFPNEARRRALSGNPVLEVAIRADGHLEQVVVRRSSGHRELDNAAVSIVRLASPFDPFPPAIRDRYPVLRFAYEWQFLDGRLGAGAVWSSR